MIYIINLFINWVVSIPIFYFSPPTNKTIKYYVRCSDIQERVGYLSADGNYYGNYLGNGKWEKFTPDKVVLWRFWNNIKIQNLLPKRKKNISGYTVTLITDRRSKEVWEYRDALGKKRHVTYDQRKNLEKDRFYTSVEDKRNLIESQVEKRLNKENEEFKQLTGKYIHNF